MTAQHAFRLDPNLRGRLYELRDQLQELAATVESVQTDVQAEADAHGEEYATASEKWQESAHGSDVGEWLTAVETLAATLDDLGAHLDATASAVEDVPEQP